MFKKILCAAIMTALLVSQAVGAFAATSNAPTVSTSTMYKDGEIYVTTTVSGVNANDEITYLAYEETKENEGITDENIAYIDQKTAEDTTVKFEYVAAAKYLGAAVMVGGLDKTNTQAYAVANDNVEGTISVTVGNLEAVSVAMPESKEGFTEIKCGAVKYPTLKIGGDDVEGWFTSAKGIWLPNVYLFDLDAGEDGKTSLTISVDGAEITTTSSVALSKVGVRNDGALVALAKMTTGDTDYGIKVSKSKDATETITADEATISDLSSKKVIYKALAHDVATGDFAVIISAEGLDFNSDLYYISAYSGSADSDDTLTVGEAVSSSGSTSGGGSASSEAEGTTEN